MSHSRPAHRRPARSRLPVPGEAVAAAVLLMVGFGVAGVYSGYVLPFASDACGDVDTHLICTAGGQRAVAVVPLLSAAAGTVTALLSCVVRPPYRVIGIVLGYVVAGGGLVTSFAIAHRI